MAYCFFLLTKGINRYINKILTYIIRFCKRHHLCGFAKDAMIMG